MDEFSGIKLEIGPIKGQVYENEMIIEGNSQIITTIIKNKPVNMDISLSNPLLIDKVTQN